MAVTIAETKTPVFCALETYSYPRTVLVKRQDERHTLSSEVQARGRSSTHQALTTVAIGESLSRQGRDNLRRVIRVISPPCHGGVKYEQHLENVRRKGLLPRLKNDRSICLFGRLFCLELCRVCLRYRVRREGTGSIPCWVSACMMAVTPPPVPLWRNVRDRDTTARSTCSGVWVGWLLGLVDCS